MASLKAALAIEPEKRGKWLQKACKQVDTGELTASQLYDVVTSRKFLTGVPEKVGQQMFRVVQQNVRIFSEKQQKHLLQDSVLASQFRPRSEPRGKEDDEDGSKGTRSTEDMASKMEEMMARCRNFVREQASGFEDRQKMCEQEEKRKEEERLRREREEEEKRVKEWELWQRSLVIWERAQMEANDEREQKRKQEQASEAAALARPNVLDTSDEAEDSRESKKRGASKKPKKDKARGKSSRPRSKSKRGSKRGSSSRESSSRSRKKRRKRKD